MLFLLNKMEELMTTDMGMTDLLTKFSSSVLLAIILSVTQVSHIPKSHGRDWWIKVSSTVRKMVFEIT